MTWARVQGASLRCWGCPPPGRSIHAGEAFRRLRAGHNLCADCAKRILREDVPADLADAPLQLPGAPVDLTLRQATRALPFGTFRVDQLAPAVQATVRDARERQQAREPGEEG